MAKSEKSEIVIIAPRETASKGFYIPVKVLQADDSHPVNGLGVFARWDDRVPRAWHGHSVESLAIAGWIDETSGAVWGLKFVYQDRFRVDLSEARAMVKTLTALNKALPESETTLDDCLNALEKVFGAKRYARSLGSYSSYSDCAWLLRPMAAIWDDLEPIRKRIAPQAA